MSDADEPSGPAQPAARAARFWSASRMHTAGALAVFVAVVALLLSTAGNLGYARDEGFYFHAARAYGEWFSLLADDRALALRRANVDRAFGVNHEHPALMKSLFALSHLVLHQRLGWFDEPGTSFRFPSIVLAGAMTGITFLWAARRLGTVAGLVAAASLIFMPRMFYQAHLACFDVPIAALFLFTFYGHARSLETRGPLWPALTGIAFGLALDTKHNSWFLPIAFVAHALVLAALAWWWRRSVWSSVRRSVHGLLAMALIGPLLMYAAWPWLWSDTLARLKEYASFHLNHEYYNMEFLGRNYFEPPMPRGYAPLMTLATVPLVTLLAALVGLAAGARRLIADARVRDVSARAGESAIERHSTLLLWMIGIGVSYGAWVFPSTPIFGGTKHWMTAYPFIALLAAAGVVHAARALRGALERVSRPLLARAALPVTALLALASPLEQSLAAHPFGLSAYTPLVGGASGGATLGLNRTFWGYTTGSLTEYLNREVPRGGKVYPHDTAWHSWEMLQLDGRLRPDIRAVGRASDADFAIYHHEMHMQGQEYQAWVAYGSVRPDVIAGLDGVPVVWVYRRR